MGWFDSSALATTTSTPPRATMKSQYTKGLMNDLHECCRIIAHTADDPVRSLQTLLAMCVNVYEHPDDERYRHIRLSNDRFHRRVWDVPGGRDAERTGTTPPRPSLSTRSTSPARAANSRTSPAPPLRPQSEQKPQPHENRNPLWLYAPPAQQNRTRYRLRGAAAAWRGSKGRVGAVWRRRAAPRCLAQRRRAPCRHRPSQHDQRLVREWGRVGVMRPLAVVGMPC